MKEKEEAEENKCNNSGGGTEEWKRTEYSCHVLEDRLEGG